MLTNGNERVTTYTGTDNGPRYQIEEKDSTGRIVRTTSPAFAGGTRESQATYGDPAHPKSITGLTRSGQATALHEFNAVGVSVREGLSADDTTLQLDSATDRITGTVTTDEVDQGNLWRVTRIYAYPTAGSAQTKLVSTTRRKLAGFTGTEVSSNESIDITGNTTTSRILLSGSGRESHLTRPGVSDEEVRTYYSGRMASQQMRGGSSPYLFGYDALGRQTSMKNPRHTQAAVTTYTTTGNQIVSNIDAAGNPTSYSYYPQGSVGAGQIKTITLADATVQYRLYTLRGELKASWGSQLNPTWNEFDVFGQLSTLHTWQIAPALNIATPPSDPPAGSATTSWNYQTATGLLIAKRDAVSLGADYEYDVAGRLTKRTWARSQAGVRLATTYTPNSFNEITNIDYADNTPNIAIQRDRLGRLFTVTQTNQSKFTYLYDPANLALDTETIQYDLDHNTTYEFTRVLDRSRDSLNRDTGFQLKDGTTIENQATYGYSATDGRLLNIIGGGDVSSPQTFTYGYTPNSNLLQTVTGPIHTVTNTWEPNRDVLDTKENKVGTDVVSNYDYTVNSIGQRTGVNTSGTAFPALPSWLWGYDTLGQVTSADSSVNTSDRSYQFDAIGNRKKSANSLTLPGTDNYTSNALNQYSTVASVSPSYDDDDGNATAYPLPVAPTTNSTLTWDAENRMVSSTVGTITTSYLYDAQSRRIGKTTGGTSNLYVYDDWNYIAEYSRSAGRSPTIALSKTNLWGTDLSGTKLGAGGVGGLLLTTLNSQSGSPSYLPTYDGNGNVSEYLASNGTVAAHFEYDPFGNTVVNTDTTNQFAYRFSTKPMDSETGLYYYGYRYYDPLTGRWLSRDPLGEQGHEVMNLMFFISGIEYFSFENLYNSMGNQPLNLVDSDGRWIAQAIAIGSGIYLLYKVVKALVDLKKGFDKAYEEGKRSDEALKDEDLENSNYCPTAVDDAAKDLSNGAKMPGVSPGGPPGSPKAFPGMGVPLPGKP